MAYFQVENKNGPNYIQQKVVYQQNPGFPPYQGGYPPQQGGYPPPYQGGYPQQQFGYQQYPLNQQIVVNQPQPVVQQQMQVVVQPGVQIANGNSCMRCGRQYTLISTRKVGGQTVLAFLLLLLIFWPLCWLPFIIDDCKDKHYHCSQCSQLIYKKEFTLCN
ncbi:unnamed protein product [Paramecium octaurelia]|uniref:LITAF domain-containing protein n=1 Tax=Paramecium octaurelia TaxID=43137 RepID=A0A8S1VD61_PAROT|nr:unnamed protein product [Paramecium octaurelia]